MEAVNISRFDKALSALILGFLPPVILFLAFWWGSLPFLSDNRIIMLLSTIGFTFGIALDFTLLRRHLFSLFKLPFAVLVAIELLYSILIYGFFMGFPVFNSIVGIFGCYILAKRGVVSSAPRDAIFKDEKHIRWVSTGILFLLCICTALLALREDTICAQVRGMLGLPFEVSIGMVWALILFGGASLLLFQNLASRAVINRTIKNDSDFRRFLYGNQKEKITH